jgi:FMN-dependent oxidoreductase (nitrilotriacetate monooxygenase family)
MSHGVHWGAWRLPAADSNANVSLAHFQLLTMAAERALFDSVFLADIPALLDNRLRPLECLDPTLLLAALAATCPHIGLIATVSTTYNDPYTVARELATLDHLSAGRAGWNIVTSDYPQANANFGVDSGLGHSGRYRRAAEFVDVCLALWVSWGDGAVVADKTTGIYADRTRIRQIDHTGPHLRVRGPLQVPRSPQVWPVLAQAGSSDDGRDLAAGYGELIYTIQHALPDAQRFYTDIKGRAAAKGRDPDTIKVMPGLIPMVAASTDAARDQQAELDALVDTDYALKRLAGMLHLPVNALDPTGTLPADLPPVTDAVSGQGRRAMILDLARSENLTIPDLLRRLSGGGHLTVAGTPDRVADTMHEWFTERAADGFTIMPPTMPGQLDAFTQDVVPLLRGRGLLRHAYTGRTMRDHYGLPRPAASR